MGIDLDYIDFAKADPENIAGQLRSFPDDCKKSWQVAEEFDLPKDYKNAQNAILLGMGGSGAANESIKEILFSANLPVEIVHDYTLPGYVSSDSLVIISSYSGTTEEVLANFEQAAEKKAKIIVISTGGELERVARQAGAPTFIFKYDSQPRMAFPYLFTPLVSFFGRLGFLQLPKPYPEICEDVSKLSGPFLPETLERDNPAKQLARELFGKIPVIYASTALKGMAARFKNQLNENAKSFAFFDVLPELNHNTIEGYIVPKYPFHVVMMESQFEYDRVQLRQRITAEILGRNNIKHTVIDFSGCDNMLCEHLLFASFEDNVSYYSALLNGANPTAIPNIKYLKSKL